MSKAFQAYGKAGKVTCNTARAAALLYFQTFSKSRKCNVIQGEQDGEFFTVKYGRTSQGEWPQSFRDVTKNAIANLPDEN